MAGPRRVFSVLSCAVLGLAAVPSPAHAQGRAGCEAGIAFIRDARARPQPHAAQASLDKALRAAQRGLGEGEHGECMEAVEDAQAALAPASVRQVARSPEEDERVQVDEDLPVSIESASVPERGEMEVRVEAGYSRLRSMSTGGDDDDDAPGRRHGRDLTVPSIEAEFGLGHGLSASIGLSYAFGNAEEARTGEAEFSLKWNVLPMQGLQPALTVIGGVSAPFGPRHDSSETMLGLLASQPLSAGRNAPVLHGNLLWFHALDRGEEERSDRYAVSVALGVPVTRGTGLFVGYAREQDSEHRRADQFIELGARQLLPAGLILGAGVGIGVGDSETDFRVLIGLQKNF